MFLNKHASLAYHAWKAGHYLHVIEMLISRENVSYLQDNSNHKFENFIISH